MENSGLNEQEISLMPGHSTGNRITSPVTICLLAKMPPLLSFFILSMFQLDDETISILTIILSAIEFYCMKNISGLQLVGLQWSIDFSNFGISVFSKPEPYVPLLSNSNFFWMSFFIFVILWTIIFFVSIFTSSYVKIFGVFICVSLQVINLLMFSKAYSRARKIVEKAVLSSIQEDVHFDLVHEEDEEKKDDTEQQIISTPPDIETKQKPISERTTSVTLPPPLAPVQKTVSNQDNVDFY